jgi:Flp pilus assembly protein protease CpaA
VGHTLATVGVLAIFAAASYASHHWWGLAQPARALKVALPLAISLSLAARTLLPWWSAWDDAFVWAAAIVGVGDAYEHIVPNRWVLFICGLGLWARWATGGWANGLATGALVGLVLGGLAMSRGLGWGDVKYGAALGLALGYPVALFGLTLGLTAAGAAALALLATGRRHRRDAMALAPYLSLGGLWGLLLLGPSAPHGPPLGP